MSFEDPVTDEAKSDAASAEGVSFRASAVKPAASCDSAAEHSPVTIGDEVEKHLQLSRIGDQSETMTFSK